MLQNTTYQIVTEKLLRRRNYRILYFVMCSYQREAYRDTFCLSACTNRHWRGGLVKQNLSNFSQCRVLLSLNVYAHIEFCIILCLPLLVVTIDYCHYLLFLIVVASDQACEGGTCIHMRGCAF